MLPEILPDKITLCLFIFFKIFAQIVKEMYLYSASFVKDIYIVAKKFTTIGQKWTFLTT